MADRILVSRERDQQIADLYGYLVRKKRVKRGVLPPYYLNRTSFVGRVLQYEVNMLVTKNTGLYFCHLFLGLFLFVCLLLFGDHNQQQSGVTPVPYLCFLNIQNVEIIGQI